MVCKCSNCGDIYLSRNVTIENAKKVAIQHNSEYCPKCGGNAFSISGLYDYVNGRPINFKGSPETEAIFNEWQRNQL